MGRKGKYGVLKISILIWFVNFDMICKFVRSAVFPIKNKLDIIHLRIVLTLVACLFDTVQKLDLYMPYKNDLAYKGHKVKF